MINKYRATYLIEHPVLIQKRIFSTGEVEKILGWPREKLHFMLSRLVKKGRLVRIKRDLYGLQPPGVKTLAKGYPFNWYLIAKALAGNKPYFISHYSAMQLQGMTSESIQTVFLSLAEQVSPPRALRIPIRFVTVSKRRFWGLEEKWVTNEEKVWVSDRERTVIDALDRSDLTGGITEVSRGLWLIKKDIDFSKLITYARRFESCAVAKRLGFLMEVLSMSTAKEREKLRQFALSAKGYAFLDPTLKKKGRCLSAWRLVLNQEPAALQKNLMT